MAIKSIIDIDLQSAEFERFQEHFNKFQHVLSGMPEQWRNVGESVQGVTSDWEKAAAAILAQRQVTKELSETTKDYSGTLSNTADLWRQISAHGEKFLKSITSASKELLGFGVGSATSFLGRFASALEVGAGILGGLGAGAFAGMTRMGGDVSQERQTALGFGTSLGELKSFRTNFSRLVDPDSFLGWVGEMETHPEKSSPFYALTGHGLSGNTERDAVAALEAVWRTARTTPLSYLGTLLSSYGVPLTSEQERRLKGTGAGEFGALLAQNRIDAARFNVPSQTALAWQNMTTELQRNLHSVGSEFERQLGAAAPVIDKFSTALTDKAIVAIDRWANAIKGVASAFDAGAKAAAPQPGDLPGDAERRQFSATANALAKSYNAGLTPFEHVIVDPLEMVLRGVGSTAFHAWAYFDAAKWRQQFEASPTLAAFNQLAASADKAFGLPAGTLEFIKQHESGTLLSGIPVGSRGEIGAMQLMPATARALGVNPRDLTESVFGAGELFKQELKKYAGNFAKAVAAYNMGDPTLDAILKAHPRDWQRYIPAGTRNYINAARFSGLNIGITVKAPPGTDVSAVASTLGAGP